MSKKSTEKNKNQASSSQTNDTVWKEPSEDDMISEVVAEMGFEQEGSQNPDSSDESDANNENISDDDVVEIQAVDMSGETQSEDEVSEIEVEALLDREELEALVAERDELKDQLLRARAEFDNYRKRIQRESELQRKRAAEKLLLDLLPVLDNLERALNHGQDTGESGLIEGVSMVFKQFLGVLDNYHVTPIVAVGELFDPNLHDAMTQQPSETYAEGVVMNEFERGYYIGDAVLRPSKVLVSSGPPVMAESSENITNGVSSTDAEADTPEQGDGGAGVGEA